MKLSTCFLMFNLLHLSAIGFSQTEKVTVKLANTGLKEFVNSVEKQTMNKFLYRDDEIENLLINMYADNTPPDEVLATYPYDSYSVNNILANNLIVIASEKILQQQIITGKIIDASTSGAMPGVNIVVKGSTIGTISDNGGNFSLSVPDRNATLVFSFIGYITQEIELAGRSVVDVTLDKSFIDLDEIVVVGYGMQKKATLSGSVTSIKGSDIIKTPAMNVSNTLAGNLPGLVVVAQSGEPGADNSFLFVRGRSSLNNNSPLIVIDGVPNRSLERIDPATIESINVMKDASAAIYGSQAANGVIIVTTKRGAVEKLTVSASLNQGWSRPTVMPRLTNSYEFATLLNEYKTNRGDQPIYLPADLEKFRDGSDPLRYPNTDWAKTILKPWSPQTISNISLTGGTEKIKAFVSLSARHQDGFFYNSASKYGQYDLRSNIDGKINDYISMSLDIGVRLEDTRAPRGDIRSIFQDITEGSPTFIARWPNGLPGPPVFITSQSSPVVETTPLGGYNNTENYVININTKINIKIPWVTGLSVTGNAAIDRGLMYGKEFEKQYTLYDWDKISFYENGEPILKGNTYGGETSLKQELELEKAYMFNALVNYDKTFADNHVVNFMVGAEAIENTSNSFYAQRWDYIPGAPEELFFGSVDRQFATGSNPGVDRWVNYFGRFNYAYQNKYLLEFVWRYQGSSKFYKDTRWGFFPGVSAGYRISEEEFWKSSSLGNVVNDLKVRASWGMTGNDKIDPYQFFSQYTVPTRWEVFVDGSGNYHNLLWESRAANLEARWEEAIQRNIGLDLSMLKYRLTLTIDYFNNLRNKILIPQSASVPQTTGYFADSKIEDRRVAMLPDVNLGKVRNHGIDFDLTYRDNINNFSYMFRLNWVYAKNKILYFDEAEGVLDHQRETGYPMYSFLLYEDLGIYHTQDDVDKWNEYAREITGNSSAVYYPNARTGDIIFKDVNGDGTVNGKDMKRFYKSGVPTWTGGFNITLGYKGFDFTTLFQGQAGAARRYFPAGSADKNYTKTYYDNRWTTDNPYSTYPRVKDRNNEYWMNTNNPSTFWLYNTDFIRLKNLELGYTVPQKWITRTGLTDFRAFVGGMNLFLYASEMKDFDPETRFDDSVDGAGSAGAGYPLMKMVNVGLSFKF